LFSPQETREIQVRESGLHLQGDGNDEDDDEDGDADGYQDSDTTSQAFYLIIVLKEKERTGQNRAAFYRTSGVFRSLRCRTN
jgi:hypothetical protein